MSVTIAGIYLDPAGTAVPNARIIIVAKRTTADTFRELIVSQITGGNGEYSFDLVPGYYRVTVSYPDQSRNTVIGDMTLEADSPPGSLNDYVRFADPVLVDPTVYAEMKRWHGITASNSSEAVTAAVVAVEAKAVAQEASAFAGAAAFISGENKEQTVINAAEAKEASEMAKSDAERAKGYSDDAQNIADANTYYITEEDPDGTLAGISGTPVGKSFRVGLGIGRGFKTYINDNGVALEISGSPSAEQVNELYGKIKTVDLELTEESSYPVAGKNGEAHIYVENKKIGGSGLSDSLHKDIQEKLGGSILSSQEGELIDENVWPALVRNGKVFGHFEGRRLSIYDIIIENPDAFDLTQAKSFAPLITNGRTLYRWRAILAMLDRLVNTRGKILGIGDSYMDFATILQILANWLYGVHGKSADGWASVCGPINGRKMYLNEMTFTFSGFTAWSIGGPDNDTSPYGCGIDGYCIYTSGTDATAKLSNFDGTRITIYHRDSGSFRYRIDGGGWVTVTTTGTGGKSKTEIMGLASGLHSIDIDTSVNTDVVAIYSFYAKNWDKAGIEVHKCGHAGARGIQYLNKISPHIPYFAKEINPDLVIIILGTNDYRYPTSNVSNFIAGVNSIVSAFRSVSPDIGIVFIAPPDTKGIPANPAVPLISFVNAARAYSAANNIEFVDWHGLTPDWETANKLGQFADDLHVNDNGATGLVNSVKDTLI